MAFTSRGPGAPSSFQTGATFTAPVSSPPPQPDADVLMGILSEKRDEQITAITGLTPVAWGSCRG